MPERLLGEPSAFKRHFLIENTTRGEEVKPELSENTGDCFVEEIELRGHIIDSLLLPKVLDRITATGGEFHIKDIAVGQHRSDPSYALIDVMANSAEILDEILSAIRDHGAVSTELQDARFETSDMEGTFPEGFYSTTNQRTEIRRSGNWISVENQEMDCGITVDVENNTARCIAMSDVTGDMKIVVGHAGVRVFPFDHQNIRPDLRVYEQQRFHGKTEGSSHPADRPGDGRKSSRRPENSHRGWPGDRTHRQRQASLPTDSRRVCRSAVRRKCARHTRY